MDYRRRRSRFTGRNQKRSRGLLLFAVLLSIIFSGSLLFRAGLVLAKNIGPDLAVRFYNRVLNLYLPGYMSAQMEGGTGIYTDITASVYPALAASEQILWYESQAEGMADYENLAAQENSRTQLMLAENESAAESGGDGCGQEGASGNGNAFRQDGEADVSASDSGQQKDSPADELTEEERRDGKAVSVNRKKLEDFDYLLQKFYQVDNTTTIGSRLLNAKKLLAYDLTVDRQSDGPVILIYHTHSQEGYKDSVANDPSTTVVGLGDYLTELLEEKGFSVLHDTGSYDVPERDRAYSVAAPNIEAILKKYPSIQVVIDLHRDGVNEDVHLVTEQNGKQTAKIMFFNGLSHTTALGDIPYLKNPYIEDNLAFSLQMQIAAAEYYPDLTRRIYLKGYRFNMHFCPKSLLVEVGAQTNTVEEAMNAMEPLAELLNKVLTGA